MVTAAPNLTAAETRVSRLLDSRREAMVADLGRWVAIPTGGDHAPGLDEFRGLVVSRLERLGAKAETVPGDPRPDWLYGERAGGSSTPAPTAICRRAVPGLPRILIACHLDTVFDPRGPFREMVVDSAAGRAVGPGVVDMKGGIVILVHALEALHEAGVPVSWTVLLNSDEETGSFRSERALRAEARRHDVGLATEPALPDGGLAVERLGSGLFRVECRGRSAHVGRDFEKGVSAVNALADVLLKIAKIADHRSGRIVSVGPLEGGTAVNAVPDRARAWGNARYRTREQAEEIGRALDALATPAGAVPSVRIDRALQRPAKPLTPQTERLALLARATAESLGQSLPFGATGGVCDGNILQDAGLPTIDTLGVRGGGLHTDQEWIDLSSLTERAQLMATLLQRIAQGALAH